MKMRFFSVLILLFSLQLSAQTGLVSGELNVSAFPSNNGDGTFTVNGTFSDPKGLYFAADVAADMSLWKANSYFKINTVTANGSTLTLVVADTYNAGFLSTGVYSIGEETENLNLPGVSTTGDSNASLSTPPDYAAKFNYILKLIDQGIPGADVVNNLSDTSSVVNPTDGDVLIAGDTLVFYTGDQWTYISLGSSNGLFQYEATAVNTGIDDNAFVTATAEGCTYERTGGAGQNTEGILSVPADAILQGLSIHFTSGQAPGNTFFLNVDYLNSSRPVNGSQNTVMPILATVANKPNTFTDAAPATNYVHAGTPLQVGIASVNDNGTRTRVRYKITNYSQQVGSNASILSIVFP